MSAEALAAADAHLGTGIGRLVDDLNVEATFADGDRAVLYRKGPLGQRGIWVGNHDMRLCKVWWPEQSMGLAGEETWRRNTSKTYADQLQGKLLLIHGDIDDNVPLATTQQLSEALTTARKAHEFKIIHNRGHDLAAKEYNGLMRDFFLRNLIVPEAADQ